MNIAILGTGAFGIALAKVLEKNLNNISMWTKFEDEAKEVSLLRENKKVLPGVKIPESTLILTDIKECINGADIIYIAVPIIALREVIKLLEPIIKNKQIICITSKGIEPETGLFPSKIIEDVFCFKNIAMISGPSFAIELANGAETGFVVASENLEVSKVVSESIKSNGIIVETTNDIIGVQVLATVKNIYAILLGILNGKGVFESTRASVLKCIINDLKKLLELLGGKPEITYSFAGIGDLLLTCMSNKSRNFSFGEKIAEGLTVDEALLSINTKTVEGLYSLRVIHDILEKNNVNIKSINLLYNILYSNKTTDFILEELI